MIRKLKLIIFLYLILISNCEFGRDRYFGH